MSNNPKKVLVIAGEYPPIKTIGRIRTAKFVMHLRSMGWQPYVLTMQYNKSNPLYSPSLEEEIPQDIAVYRVANTSIDEAVFTLIKRLIRTPSAAINAEQPPSSEQSPRNEPTPTRVGIRQRLITGFKSFTRHWLHIPDDQIVWAWRSYRVALDIIKKENIDLIYTSFPPFSAALTGYRLKKKTGLPWVVDYRDLWTDDVLREWIPPLRQWLESKLEKKLIRQADAVIAVSEQKTEYLKTLLSENHSSWHTITNGYDLEAFEDLLSQERVKNDLIDFVYTGRLFKNRRGYSLAHALGQIKSEYPDLIDKVRVHFYGGVSPEIQAEYDRLIKQYDLEGCFVFHGDVDFDTSKKVQVEADYLLLIVDTGKTADGVIPGKLFEYVASKRPIFALCDSAATTDIITKANIGTVVPVNDVDQCKESLLHLIKNEPPTLMTDVNTQYLEQFDRKYLTKRLADAFHALL